MMTIGKTMGSLHASFVRLLFFWVLLKCSEEEVEEDSTKLVIRQRG